MYPHNTTKRCTKCGEEKPLSEFHTRAASPDGLRPMCKVCVKAYQQQWRIDPRYAETIRQKAAEKRAHYYIRAVGYRAAYRARVKADPQKAQAKRDKNRHYEQQQYQNNPDYRHRKRIRQHRMRAKPTRIGYTRREWEELCTRYNHRCLCCGKQKPLTADHIIPLSRGGATTINNIQPLCVVCNSQKHTRTIDYRKLTQSRMEWGD